MVMMTSVVEVDRIKETNKEQLLYCIFIKLLRKRTDTYKVTVSDHGGIDAECIIIRVFICIRTKSQQLHSMRGNTSMIKLRHFRNEGTLLSQINMKGLMCKLGYISTYIIKHINVVLRSGICIKKDCFIYSIRGKVQQPQNCKPQRITLTRKDYSLNPLQYSGMILDWSLLLLKY